MFPAARWLEAFRRRSPSREHFLNRPALVAHPLQIAYQLMTHLLSERVVVSALRKIPRGIASQARELVPDFTQRTFQLCRNALQQRGTRLLGCCLAHGV